MVRQIPPPTFQDEIFFQKKAAEINIPKKIFGARNARADSYLQ